MATPGTRIAVGWRRHPSSRFAVSGISGRSAAEWRDPQAIYMAAGHNRSCSLSVVSVLRDPFALPLNTGRSLVDSRDLCQGTLRRDCTHAPQWEMALDD